MCCSSWDKTISTSEIMRQKRIWHTGRKSSPAKTPTSPRWSEAELTPPTRLVITVIMLDTSKLNVLSDVKDKGNPTGCLHTEEEEEPDQVAHRTSRGEEWAHHHRGREERHMVEGGTSTTVLESPRSLSSRKTMTSSNVEAPQDPKQDF